jgi:hypothetical protein
MAPTWNDDTDAPSGINFPESYVVEFNPSPVPEPASSYSPSADLA